MEVGHRVSKRPHPKETSNLLSRVSFFYNWKLFIKGYRKSLESCDLYDVLRNLRSKELGDTLETQWKVEENKKRPLICRALWNCYGKTFLLLGLIQFFNRITTTACLPEAISKLVSYFSPGQKDMTKNDAILYGCMVIGICILNMFFYSNCQLALTELGIRVRTSVCSLLYRKSLKLSAESLSKVTIGKIITIMTKDVDALSGFIFFGNDVWIGLAQTGLICYLIYSKIGVAAFAGVTFFALILPLQAFIGKLGYNLRLQSSKKTDERLELIQETLSAIKIIKMYTWELYFDGKINSARKEELKKLQKLFFTKVWIVALGSICSRMAFFIFFITYVWMSEDANVTAEIVFYIMSCFSDLEYAFSTLMPLSLSYASETYATVKRIENVLTSKELSSRQQTVHSSEPKIVFKELNLDKGLYIVIGCVGSGKTRFLRRILQEVETDDHLEISGSISYASQEPWLFPSTLRNNILFGEEYDEQRYKEVLRVCDLDYDLEVLADGDGTIIGDHGTNLSKGQQTRVNLARAIYRDVDIYLLDDSLASLDTYVSEHVFKECICEFLKDKLCIFVTNDRRFLDRSDKVIVVENGTVKMSQKSEIRHESNIKATKSNYRVLDTNLKENGVYQEIKKSGKVSLGDYHKYMVHGGGIFVFSLVMVLFVAAQGSSNYSDKLLSDWVTLEQNIANYKMNETDVTELTEKRNDNLNFYIIIVISSTVLDLIRSFAFFNFARIASISLHKTMTRRVLNSTMNFFDSNFLGNILNRFSKDCLTVDELLPFTINACLKMIFVASGGIILLTTVSYIFLLESLVLLVLAYLLKRFCQPTGRNLQRLNVTTRSPMIGHLNVTLEGLTTIRASNAQDKVTAVFDDYQNVFTSANYMLNNCQIALGFSLDFICNIFIALIMVQFLIADIDPSVGDVGLAIYQSFIVTDIISIGIKNVSDCENLMTSVERIVEYTNIEQEKKNGAILEHWPVEGAVNFSDVSLSYPQKNQTLDCINFDIKPKKKLGVVGRTGAGKSSLVSSLLRLYQTQGTITVDGIDIRNINLDWLRSKISVIPQDPFLFSGTVRENLDPLKHYTDQEMWKILTELGLKNVILDLSKRIDKGCGLSVGQKQQLSLARAILRKSKIVVLDEATANVDQEIDELIRDAVQKYFADSTVIVVAHKLLSVLSCDNVLVLDKGKICELGDPLVLVKDQNSFLCNVVK